MGKHGVLVWDRIFEGRAAKSAAELARIGNARRKSGREKMVGLGEQESCWHGEECGELGAKRW